MPIALSIVEGCARSARSNVLFGKGPSAKRKGFSLLALCAMLYAHARLASEHFLSSLRFFNLLVSCRRSSQQDSNVIPGKLASPPRPGIRDPLVLSPLAKGETEWGFWIPVFTGMATQPSGTFSVKFCEISLVR